MMAKSFKLPAIKIALVVFITTAIILLPVATFANKESAEYAGQEAEVDSLEENSIIMASNPNGANNYNWPDDPEFDADDLYLLYQDFNYEGSTNEQTVAYAFWFHDGDLFVAVAMQFNKEPDKMELNGVPVQDGYYKLYNPDQNILTIDSDNYGLHQKAAEDAAKHNNSRWLIMNFGEVTLTELQVEFKLTVTTLGAGHNLGDDGTVFIVFTPALKLTKEAEPANYDTVGQEITYTFTVQNNGNATFENVTVEDPLFGLDFDAGTLAPGEDDVFTYFYPVTQNDLNAGSVYNVATATGTFDDVDYTDTDDATITAVQDASIKLTKTAVSVDSAGGVEYAEVQYYAVGDVIHYEFTVENDGNVTLTDVTVEDPLVTVEGDPLASLAPGAIDDDTTFSATYVVTQANLDAGQVDNTATATGYFDGDPYTGTDSETVYAEQNASIKLTKTAVSVEDADGEEYDEVKYYAVGDVLHYEFTVENDGNVTLTDVIVTDPLVTVEGDPLASLAPGAIDDTTFSATYVVTQANLDAGQVDNTATATGYFGGATYTDVDSETVYAFPQPDISVEKKATSVENSAGDPYDELIYYAVGDVINYEITVTNEGNMTLDVILGDVLFGWVDSAEKELGLLEPGESVTVDEGSYTIKQSDLDTGQVVNTVTAYGRYNNLENGAKEWVEDSDDETVTGFQDPSISLDKSATHLNHKAMDPVIYNKAGDVITYTFTVVNTGNVTLMGVQIDDELTGSEGLEVEPSTLKPGDTGIATATYTITKADLDAGSVYNEATVTAYDPNEDEVTGTDKETVKVKKIVPPDLEVGINLIKSADPQTYSEAGEKITYTFTVENTGEVKLTDISITEDTFSGSGELPDPEFVSSSQDSAEGTLVAGESATYTAVYLVTQADIDAGHIENAAAVTGDDPDKAPVTDSDDETIEAVQNVSIGIDKEADVATYDRVGDIINYTIEVNNQGNVTLTDVKITDDLLTDLKLDDDPDFDGSLGDMAPGDSVTVTGSYTITQSDLDEGSVENIATVTGYFDGVKYEKSDKAIVKADQKAEIKLTKRANVRTYSNEGDLIKYTFKIENTGNVTLYNVKLNDPTAVLSGGPIAELAPGEVDRDTFTGTYKITRSDLYAWKVVNKAYVTAQDPDDRDVTAYDSATVTAVVDFPEVDFPTPPTGGNIIQLLAIALVLTGSGIALKRYKK